MLGRQDPLRIHIFSKNMMINAVGMSKKQDSYFVTLLHLQKDELMPP